MQHGILPTSSLTHSSHQVDLDSFDEAVYIHYASESPQKLVFGVTFSIDDRVFYQAAGPGRMEYVERIHGRERGGESLRTGSLSAMVSQAT
jgi:hypothetical protein